jgi:hypothetical protein
MSGYKMRRRTKIKKEKNGDTGNDIPKPVTVLA